MSGSRLVVRGNTTTSPIMLDTHEAKVIEFHDVNGNIMALFGRVGAGDNWVYANKNDDDFDAIVATFIGDANA